MRNQPEKPRLPFSWVGGERCLDFLNTVAWADDGLREERLRSYADLASWAAEAGLLTSARALVALGSREQAAGQRVLEHALALRRDLHALLSAMAHGRPIPRAALLRINGAVARSMRGMRLSPGTDGFSWRWAGASKLELPLWRLAWCAAGLLTSPELRWLRACANEQCGWLFIDRSRRKNRRWCEMSACGGRDKARRYYRRARRARRLSARRRPASR